MPSGIVKKIPVKKSVASRRGERRETSFVVPKPPMRMYSIVAASFVLVVAAILGLVLYVSAVKATITVVSKTTPVQTEFVLDVAQIPTRASEIRGRVLSAVLGKQKTIIPTSQGQQEVPGIARGTVTIKNDSSSSQQLVRTTRLLTPDGTLFRIDKAVVVPAGKSLEVPAYADQPGKSGDIGPSTFTIPGLPAERQKVVYAVSTEPFVGGVSVKAVVSQEALDQAGAAMRAELVDQIKGVLREEAGTVFDAEAFKEEVVSEQYSVRPGEEASSFEITMSVRVVGVFYDQRNLEEIAIRQLYERLTQGSQFLDESGFSLKAEIDRYDVSTEAASLQVKVSGRSIASSTSAALAPERFVGMTEEQVQNLLMSEGVAEDVTVEISPSFIKTIPRFQDHVYVKIE
jgi:hypothetical protein